MNLVILLPILAVLMVFIGYRFAFGHRSTGIDDFFLASQTIESQDYQESSIAFGFQVAAISLFSIWGYQYGIWTIWVPIFWLIGYLLFLRYIDSIDLLVVMDKIDKETIHSYLSKVSGGNSIKVVAAMCSILGLSGTAFFEAEFTAGIISGFSNSCLNLWKYSFMVLFVALSLLYIIRGGLKNIYLTDRIQMLYGFFLFNLFYVFTLFKALESGNHSSLSFLAVMSLMLFSLAFIVTYRNKSIRKSISYSLLIILILIILFIFYMFFQNAFTDPFTKDVMNSIGAENIFGLGTLSLVSLLIANGLWQFVDISNWQRISSLNRNGAFKENLKNELKVVGLYSPFTWVVAIFFGIALKSIKDIEPSGWTALNDYSSILMKGDYIDLIFVIILCIALIFAMFSTLDSILSSLSFTLFKDLTNSTSISLKRVQLLTVLLTLGLFVVYLLIRILVNQVDNILYTFYAFQLAMFPAIFFGVLEKSLNYRAAMISIAMGLLGTIIPLIINNEVINPYSAAALFSVSFSLIGYLVFKKILK